MDWDPNFIQRITITDKATPDIIHAAALFAAM
jgi:hypothetical protein